MLNSVEIKHQICLDLNLKYGLREAENIAAYYLDAYRDKISQGLVTQEKLSDDIGLLLQDTPIQYLTQTSFFYGHNFHVNSHVLIPRPETEELVHWVISDYKSSEGQLCMLDIGTGSGCILLSICKSLPHLLGTGIDISSEALSVMGINAERMGIATRALCIDVLKNDLSDIDQTFDIIVSNPPYILMKELGRMGENVIGIEPEEALFVHGQDPLVFYDRILQISQSKLKPDGYLYFETSDLYHEEMEELVQRFSSKYEFRRDLQGSWRMLKVQF